MRPEKLEPITNTEWFQKYINWMARHQKPYPVGVAPPTPQEIQIAESWIRVLTVSAVASFGQIENTEEKTTDPRVPTVKNGEVVFSPVTGMLGVLLGPFSTQEGWVPIQLLGPWGRCPPGMVIEVPASILSEFVRVENSP